MAEYKCFNCDKNLSADQMRKRVRCIYCGSKIVFKPRTKPTIVDAV
ncbi:MAG: DNA-directed RNA polymerase subunit P [Candidatus Woesearchaeota archaeon]